MQTGFMTGRIVLGLFYLVSAFNGLVNAGAEARMTATKGVPAAELAVIVAHLLLLFAAFCILSGYRPVAGVVALVVFFIPVTFIMHSFWAETDAGAKMMQQVQFMKNIALWASALMLLAIPRPWPYSIEERIGRQV